MTNCPGGRVADLKLPVILSQGLRIQIFGSLLAGNTALYLGLTKTLPFRSPLAMKTWNGMGSEVPGEPREE